MRKTLLLLVALLSAPAYGQSVGNLRASNNLSDVASPSSSLSNLVSGTGIFQFALSQSGLGTPTGTMSGYVAGDTVTLSCTGVTFSISPIIGITHATGGAADGATVSNPGATSGNIPSGPLACSQASTTGSGTGFQITADKAVIAAYLYPAGLSTGGTATNGNFFLNSSPLEQGALWPAGSENSYLGVKSGFGLGGISTQNLAVGHNACGNGGSGAVSGLNVCVGADAGRNFQAAAGSTTLVGAGAGRNIANGWDTFVGAGSGGSEGADTPGSLTGYNDTAVGYSSGPDITSGSGNLFAGAKSGTGITTGGSNIILEATAGGDNCGNGNESNVVAVCAGAGRVLTITGTGTPSTSVAKFSGALVASSLTGNVLQNNGVPQSPYTGTLLWGTGADGNVTISSGTTTLSRDLHVATLTINGTGAINTQAYRIFSQGVCDLSAAQTGAIYIVANAGTAASGATAGTGGGISSYGGTAMRAANGGSNGAAGSTGVGGASANIGSAASSGGYGGVGGTGGASTNAGGAGGTSTNPNQTAWRNTPQINLQSGGNSNGTAGQTFASNGGSGGGAGGGDGTNLSGAGGGGGGSPGGIQLNCRTIARGTNTNTAIIQSKGAVGGAGGNASATGNSAGGAAGGGGGGGDVYIVTEQVTGSPIANAIDVSGGAGGAGGTGTGTGKGGQGGQGGQHGHVEVLVLTQTGSTTGIASGSSVSSAVFNATTFGSAASATTPSTPSTTAGGAGTAGLTMQVGL